MTNAIMMSFWRGRTQRRRLRLLAAAVVATGVALSLIGAVPARAATPGVSTSPSWFPLRGAHLIGCTYRTCESGTYHPYWALDIKGAKDESVYAAGAGKVVAVVTGQGANCNADIVAAATACPDGSKGNSVTIDHAGSFSYYTHFTSVAVKVGDVVDENTIIGTVGDSGYSTPNFFHLHFERRTTAAWGSSVDPGPLKGCVGGALKTYPDDLTPAGSHASWSVLPTEKYTATSDGTSCTGGTGGTPGGASKPKVDLVFAIDSTGSMTPYIDAVTASARKITNSLFTSSDARVALVDYKDLYSGCASDGYAARVDLPFTANAESFGPAVDKLVAQGGCDTEESVYSGIMTALKLPWRAGAKRSVIVMGDAAPHDPEPTTKYTKATVTAAAKSSGVDLTGPVTATAKGGAGDADAAVAGGDPGVSLYTVNIDGGGSPYFEDLAGATGGASYPASDPTTAVDQITSAITAITATSLVADAGGPYAGAVGDPVTFDAGRSAPADQIASYEWDFDGNGSYETTSSSASTSHTFDRRYSGPVGLRIVSSTSPVTSATATTQVTVARATRTRYTGHRAGRAGRRAWLEAVVSSGRRAARGLPVTFALDGATCTDTTDGQGRAGCLLRLPKRSAVTSVTVETTSNRSYLGSADEATFRILSPRHHRHS